MADELTFSILGSVAAARAGAPVDVGARKQRALLALLLLDAGRAVSVDRLIEELWSDDPPAGASASLQAYVSHLRRALEPARAPGAAPSVLCTESPGYRLAIDPEQLDAARFARQAADVRSHLTAGRLAEARGTADAALAGWQGDPLAEFASETWAQAEIARLDELRIGVCEDRLRAMLELGDAAGAVVDLEGLVETHPYRERLWALLMLALYRSGRTADALARYQRARQVLGDDLGLDPGPELRELEAAILRQDAALRPPPAPRAAQPGSPSSPSTLIGRDQELVLVDRLVASMATADPSWLVLEGEAGIGKTRLAEELASRAAAAGATVVWGRCHEDHDAPGFWPWLQVLRGLGDDASGLGANAGSDRFGLYEEVVRLLAAHAAIRPVLVVLDDLHWADLDTLRLLAFVAVQLRDVPLSLAVTCRSAEPTPELAEALATVARRRGVTRASLGPLSVADVSRLAATINDEDLGQADAARLHARTEGNPFLVGELLRLPPGARADALPGGVRDVLSRRLATVPDETRTALTVAAVIGRHFDLALLARATGVDIDRVADLVDAAAARRIVVAGDHPMAMRFAHDLLRDTLLEATTDIRRRRLHARVAEALASMPDAHRRITELARHQLDAVPLVDPLVAIDTAVEAAARAEAALAFDEAVGWYSAALHVLEVEPSVDPHGARLQHLMLDSARAMARAGRVLPWRERVTALLRLASERGDVEAFVEGVSVLVSGGAAWLWSLSYEDPTEVLAILQRALDALGPSDSASRARITAAIAQGVYYREGVDRAAVLAREALAMARRDGDAALVADMMLNLAQCLWGADHVDEQLAVANEVLSLPAAGRGIEHELACRAIRTTLLLITGELQGADAEYARFVELADEHGRRGVLAQLAWYPPTRATVVGDFAAFDAAMDDAYRLQESLEIYLKDVIRAGAWAIRCCAADQVDAIGAEAVGILTAIPFGAGAVYPGLIDLRHGRLDDARERFDAVANLPHRFRDWAWLANMTLWAELAAAVGDHATVEEGLRLLHPHAHRFAVSGTAIGAAGPVAYAIARLEHALGDDDAASASIEVGRALATRMGAATWAAKADDLLT